MSAPGKRYVPLWFFLHFWGTVQTQTTARNFNCSMYALCSVHLSPTSKTHWKLTLLWGQYLLGLHIIKYVKSNLSIFVISILTNNIFFVQVYPPFPESTTSCSLFWKSTNDSFKSKRTSSSCKALPSTSFAFVFLFSLRVYSSYVFMSVDYNWSMYVYWPGYPPSSWCTVSQQWLQPMLDGKRNFISESFLRHTYMKIWIGAKNIHRALFEKICFLKAENSLFQSCSIFSKCWP